jgi:CRP-like cAMP-binding protein
MMGIIAGRCGRKIARIVLRGEMARRSEKSPNQSSTEAELPLERAELLRALSSEQLARIRPQLRERRIIRQRALFFEGAEAESLWIVRRGQVRLYKASQTGRVTTLEVLGPGQIFGAISALDAELYPATAEGVTDGAAWSLPRSTLMRLLAEDPRLGLEVLRIVAGRLHEAQERLRSFAHDSAPARLARALLDATHDGEAHVTRRALAETAGTTVETAIRVLRRFEREGLLHGEVGLLRVVDPESLRRLAGQR